MNNPISVETLNLLKTALAKAADPAELAKSATFVQPNSPTVGLQPYNLEAAAKQLYPVLTPLRNRIARVGTTGGTQANWKSIVGIDTGSIFAGISEGHRGSVINVATKENFAAFRTIGAESTVTDEAELAAEGFDDIRARAVASTLQSLMIAEEKIILGGNTSFALGVTPTPTLAAGTAGSIPATTTVSVIAVALTLDGKQRSSVSTGVAGMISRITADGFTENFGGGSGIKSSAATVATGGAANGSVTATVPWVPGAFGYAWFAGTAGNEHLAAITTINQTVITALPTGTQAASALPSADASTNSLIFDGLLTMASNPLNGGYQFAANPGAGLTSDNQGGIVEFDVALQWFWDNLRLSPSRILVSSQESLTIRRKILAGGTGSSARFTFTMSQGQIVGGGMPRGYLNPFSMSGGPAEIPFELHPNMPAGTVLFVTDDLPYPMSNVSTVMRVLTRKEYHQIDWPRKTRQYEYGVYSDEVLQHYFTPSMGLITNLSAN